MENEIDEDDSIIVGTYVTSDPATSKDKPGSSSHSRGRNYYDNIQMTPV